MVEFHQKSSKIKQIKSDIYVVVAFKILPESILKIPQKGAVNLHASLLPMFRGAAPINHAILNGETKTGVTTFQIRQSVDTGDILLQDIISLNNSITAGEVYNELAQTGAVLLVKAMDGLDQGSIFPKKQHLTLGEYRLKPPGCGQTRVARRALWCFLGLEMMPHHAGVKSRSLWHWLAIHTQFTV